MMIKFTSHGRGSAKAAADYLLQPDDHKGDKRPGIEVLRGDPYTVASVADSLEFSRKYSSAVIAWHPDDKPTEEQINAVLDDFEEMSFSGLDPERRSMSAVLHHEDNGSVHVHVLIARTDLETGLSFNPAPPGWQKSFDPIRDYHNAKNGWQSPNPELQPEIGQLLSASPRTDRHYAEKVAITELLATGIASGAITDRDDIMATLKDAGIDVSRATKNSITVINENGAKMRLTGSIYEKQFSTDQLAERISSAENSRERRADPGALESLRRQIGEKLGQRAAYVSKRFSRNEKNVERDDRKSQAAAAGAFVDLRLDPADFQRFDGGVSDVSQIPDREIDSSGELENDELQRPDLRADRRDQPGVSKRLENSQNKGVTHANGNHSDVNEIARRTKQNSAQTEQNHQRSTIIDRVTAAANAAINATRQRAAELAERISRIVREKAVEIERAAQQERSSRKGPVPGRR